MLKNSCVRATLSCNARGIRLTSQVPHRFRRLTSYPQQDPQRAAQRLYQRHAYGISTIADKLDGTIEEFLPPVVQALLCASLAFSKLFVGPFL
ncbi:hypothetical protein WJX79_000148 [Trebouxia sp. C0005]